MKKSIILFGLLLVFHYFSYCQDYVVKNGTYLKENPDIHGTNITYIPKGTKVKKEISSDYPYIRLTYKGDIGYVSLYDLLSEQVKTTQTKTVIEKIDTPSLLFKENPKHLIIKKETEKVYEKRWWNIKWSYYLLGLVVPVFFMLLALLNKKKKEKLQKIRNGALKDFYNSIIHDITSANMQFNKYLDHGTGYFSNYTIKNWLKQNANLYFKIIENPISKEILNNAHLDEINTFTNFYINAEEIRTNNNLNFIDNELLNYKLFFDDIEGRNLDKQQRKAIISDDDNNLIIAGAGSGKTTTIVGKINYIIERYKIKPEDILLISFTNKSAQDIQNRIQIEGLEAKTFHKFGKEVIRKVENIEPRIYSQDIDNIRKTNTLNEQLRIFHNELENDPKYLANVISFFKNYLKPIKSKFDFNSQGEYFQYMNDNNLKTYKLKISKKTTLLREVVKSAEECQIANFFVFNSIDYEYEKEYEYDKDPGNNKVRYRPDFSIFHGDKRIYLEHFGINRNNKVPDWFKKSPNLDPSQEYLKGIEWKIATHKKYKTTLLQSFSYEMQEGILFKNIEMNLKKEGIFLQPKTDKEILEIIKNSAPDEIDSFVNLFSTFITLLKSNNYTIKELIEKNKKESNLFQRERNNLFLNIIQPIYEKYINFLFSNNEIDFSDMINKASNYIESKKIIINYKYIIIDEFQDISIGRYKLIKAIKTNKPSCKLFCVGDDWQSIYRFTGSDISLFKNYEDYFGFTIKSKIETTYRFHNPLIKLSSEFILKNKNQNEKNLKSISSNKKTEYEVIYSEDDDNTFSVKRIFEQIIENDSSANIYILGRFSHALNSIKNKEKIFSINSKSKNLSYQHLTAPFMTIHSAKGLEADYIIILNCNSGKYGFPSEIADDPVLKLVLSNADSFENGEERRLFYVAMTRAKKKVYFIVNKRSPSKFISEITNNNQEIRKCKKCVTSIMVLRATATNSFYGCINFPYGCTYIENV